MIGVEGFYRSRYSARRRKLVDAIFMEERDAHQRIKTAAVAAARDIE